MPLLHSCNHYYVCGGIRIKPELFALLRKKSVLTVNIIWMQAKLNYSDVVLCLFINVIKKFNLNK